MEGGVLVVNFVVVFPAIVFVGGTNGEVVGFSNIVVAVIGSNTGVVSTNVFINLMIISTITSILNK